MMKKANGFKAIPALVLVLALLTSCGLANKSDSGSKKTDDVPVSQDAVVTSLTAKKLFSFENEVSDLYESALVYRQDEKKGIRLYSGKDTGAVYGYVYMDTDDGLFYVSDNYENYDNSDTVSSVNVFGVLDPATGKESDCKYACFEKMNDRYLRAYTATAKADEDTDEKTIKKGKHFVSQFESGTEYLYETQVFDLKTGEIVDANEIKYFDSYSNSGNKSFSDGSYLISTTETDTVYNTDDQVLFTYNPNQYQIDDYKSGYYIAKKTVNGTSTYYLLDRTGKTQSAEFSSRPDVVGKMLTVFNNNSSYDCYWFDGTPVLNETYEHVTYDELSKDLYVLESNNKSYTFINGSGEVLLTVKESKNVTVDQYNGIVKQTDKDGATGYYNFEKKDYSITAYSVSNENNMLLKVSDGDNRYDLVDATNGKTLLEGYGSSFRSGKPKDGCCFVAAPRTEGGYDIYKIQNKVDAVKNSLADDALISDNQLLKIYETKEAMFTELETALKSAGLSATIDRDNGEIMFDAAVVFSGDSADVSDSGKQLLDAFIKAYGSVLTNDKYKGFIEKTVVEGHTAPLATSTYESGLPLSQSRADNVKKYCQTIDATLAQSFEAKGYSNSMPIYNLDGTINQDASRRVTFKCVINNEF
ncbi:MAG: OmpA family protein [Clostridia bacterium]|nr:OmpA family protein [Clostridia bacterium]